MDLVSKIESILFVSSKPLTAKQLAKTLNVSEEEVTNSLGSLIETKKNSGVVVLEANGIYQLATNRENVEAVKNFLNAELREKLTEATVEVLAIIAYRQPISKAEIEAIRGVNSQYSIRHLLMRGLVDKVANPSDARGSLYQVTTEFLQHLGIQSVSDLPEFEKLVEHIKLPETPGVVEQIEKVEDTEELEEIEELTSSAETSSDAETMEERPEDLREKFEDSEIEDIEKLGEVEKIEKTDYKNDEIEKPDDEDEMEELDEDDDDEEKN